MMQQSEDIQELKPRKKKPQVDQSEALSQLYEYVIWCGNAINQLNVIVAQLQQQITPYPPAQQNPSYQEIDRTPPVEANPNTPTFSKRTKPVVEEPEQEEKPAKPPWYRQKGIIATIILVVIMLYFVWVFYMKSTGHSVSIPGLGKF